MNFSKRNKDIVKKIDKGMRQDFVAVEYGLTRQRIHAIYKRAKLSTVPIDDSKHKE